MTGRPPRHLAVGRERRTPPRPPRRPRNGHHPDCPYPRDNPATCGICAGIRKAAPDPEDP